MGFNSEFKGLMALYQIQGFEHRTKKTENKTGEKENTGVEGWITMRLLDGILPTAEMRRISELIA